METILWLLPWIRWDRVFVLAVLVAIGVAIAWRMRRPEKR
ncbi:MAG: hypothetical protein G01um101472_528 [Parcubacteria group bacterium Gr01-1014_72]|nr:MAG: hypothetical protein G01um101472_528 [Parcubacteria group bacterium Gr01-1014_72]